VVTVTPTVPTFAGAVAVIVVGESTETWDDSFGPKYTALASLNPLPEMRTVAPPPDDTASGLSEATKGDPGFAAGRAGVKETPGVAAAGTGALPGTRRRYSGPGVRRGPVADRSRAATVTAAGGRFCAAANLEESRVTMTVRRQSPTTRTLCRLCRHRFPLVTMRSPFPLPARRETGNDGNGTDLPPISATRLTQ
jgi:hypothetical protein